MKKIYLVFLISLLSTVIHAQVVNFEWAKSIGGVLDDKGLSITTDASGNVYVTGYYKGTVDFNPGAGIFNLISNGNEDIFIQKLDENGDFIWAKSVGGTYVDYGNSIKTDASGNVYITGFYQGTADFDPDGSTFNLTSNGLADVFVQKLDANGNFIWAKSMGGTVNDGGNSIDIDASGNLYVTGFYTDTADFDPSGSTFNLTSNGWADIFIQKLDANGNFIWAKSMGGTVDDAGHSVVTDGLGNIYITGVMGSSIGLEDIFVQKLDANGSFIWFNSMGALWQDKGNSITTDPSGNVVVTGYFTGSVDFDPSSASFSLISKGLADIFIQKLDAGGNLIWAKSVGGTGHDESLSIISDASGNVYITGFYSDSVDFDPGPATFSLNGNGLRDIYILKLSESGNFIWAKSIGGTANDAAHSINMDISGNMYLTGSYEETADFDPSGSTFNLTSNGSFDVFTERLNQWPDGVEESNFSIRLKAYPNPTKGEVKILLGKEYRNVRIRVKDLSGRIISTETYESVELIVQKISDISGMYFIEISSDDGERAVLKVIKN